MPTMCQLDIIIPAYNVAPETLGRCLASIACQTFRDFAVTIVDDASERAISGSWWPYINGQRQLMEINLVRRDQNGGPGLARQTGLDKTEAPFVTFIDADDTLNGALALTTMHNIMTGLPESDKFVMASCAFDEIHETDIPEEAKPGPVLVPHVNDMVWMFGKIYRRSFLKDNGIRFHPTSRANEDNGFNQQFRLLSDDDHRVAFSPFHVYYWHETEGSITRRQNCEYSYGGGINHSFGGYCENMAYAIQCGLKKRPGAEHITRFAAECMASIYWYYVDCCANSPNTAADNLEHAAGYYRAVFKGNEPEKTEMTRIFGMTPHAPGLMPEVTFWQFINQLENVDVLQS